MQNLLAKMYFCLKPYYIETYIAKYNEPSLDIEAG
jgi:hypothetical protein